MGLLNVRQQKYLHTMHKVMENRNIQGGKFVIFYYLQSHMKCAASWAVYLNASMYSPHKSFARVYVRLHLKNII